MSALLLAPLPSMPPAPGGLAALPLDKVAHLLLYLGLTRAWRRAVPGAPRLFVALAAAAHGGLLELAQGALGVRSAEWGDLAADALGAVLALLPRGGSRPG